MAKKAERRDTSTLAFDIMQQATDQKAQSEKDPAAVALGRLGGIKGGPARALVLSTKQRKEIAAKAALARWHGKKK